MHQQPQQSSQRAINLPGSVIALSVILIAIELIRSYLITDEQDLQIILMFAFNPARYGYTGTEASLVDMVYPGGLAADFWTFLTYAFLHGGIVHVLINLAWLVIFGTAIAWRFSAIRFFLFAAVCAIIGSFVHWSAYYGDFAPAVGASAALSGLMAGSVRFIFVPGGVLSLVGEADRKNYLVPAVPFRQIFWNVQILIFVSVWFILNFIMGLAGNVAFGIEGNIAWQAHIGGFFAGLLLFDLFDPVKIKRDDSRPHGA